MADVVILTNPLDVSRRRCLQLPDDVALLAWVEQNAPAVGGIERRVFVNGHALPLADYRTRPGDEILVTFAPGVFGFTAAQIGYFVAQALVSAAIGYVLGKIFAPSQPSAGNTPQPSQVYGIAPPKNAARLGQPIPAIYGSVIALPDFAAQPYVEFVGNEQYLCAILCIGVGEFDVTELLLGNTSADPLDDDAGLGVPPVVQWRIFGPRDHQSTFGVIEGVTPVRENVVTSPAVSDQELIAPNVGQVFVVSTWYWALSGVFQTHSPPGYDVDLTGAATVADKLARLPASPALGTVVHVLLGFDGSTYTGGTYTAAAYTADQNTAPGSLIPPPTAQPGSSSKWIGPFTTCKAGQRGTVIELDFVFGGGLFSMDGSGNLHTRAVDVQVSAWPMTSTGELQPPIVWTQTFTAADNTPQRFTVQRTMPAARYQVAVQRLTDSDGKATTSDHVTWTGLKFQLVPVPASQPVYGNVTLAAVLLKATNGISSDAASSLRFRVTRRLAPLGDPNAPTAPTTNPADAFVDVMCAAYGGARPVNADELDLDELARARALWEGTNGFNAVFDQPSTVWEALGRSVQTVHAAPLPVGSRMTVIHDAVQPVRAQLFTDANIVAGSLQVTYNFDQTGTPEGIRVNYRDPQTFSPATVDEPEGAPDFTTMDLFGCTDVVVAHQHADLAQAKRRLQRKSITFATELEGLNCLPGDRIGVAARMVQWAQSARVEYFDGARTLRLDAALSWTPGATHAVQLRDVTGAPWPMVGVTPGADAFALVLPDAPPIPIYGATASLEPTQLSFGVEGEEIVDWTLGKVTPNGDTVTLDAINYAPEIYDVAALHTREPWGPMPGADPRAPEESPA